MNRVLILTNSLDGLYNFRKELIEQLVREQKVIIIASPKSNKADFFIGIGCRLIETNIDRRGKNPLMDIRLFFKYIEIILLTRPSIVLTYTIKPNIYGGIACRLLRKPYIANITGLGTSLENEGMLRFASLRLYKTALKKANCVFFQNESNRNFFLSAGIIKNKTRLIPGSGVNLERFTLEEYPAYDDEIRLLFIGRIMRAKGVEELFTAIKKVKGLGYNIELDVIGYCEEDYNEVLSELVNEGFIKYHGRQDDVRTYIRRAHAIVLPSYHEGLSNVLLESASTGRPVLASNVPGCKETFVEGISGMGFSPKNAENLADTIIAFVNLPYEIKRSMGLAGRLKMEREFDRKIVLDAYKEEIENTLIKEA